MYEFDASIPQFQLCFKIFQSFIIDVDFVLAAISQINSFKWINLKKKYIKQLCENYENYV